MTAQKSGRKEISTTTYTFKPVTVDALTAWKNALMALMFLWGYRMTIPRMLSPRTKASCLRNVYLDCQNSVPSWIYPLCVASWVSHLIASHRIASHSTGDVGD